MKIDVLRPESDYIRKQNIVQVSSHKAEIEKSTLTNDNASNKMNIACE